MPNNVELAPTESRYGLGEMGNCRATWEAYMGLGIGYRVQELGASGLRSVTTLIGRWTDTGVVRVQDVWCRSPLSWPCPIAARPQKKRRAGCTSTRIPKPEPRNPKLESRIPNPETRISNLDSRIPNTEYRIQNTEYRNQDARRELEDKINSGLPFVGDPRYHPQPHPPPTKPHIPKLIIYDRKKAGT